MSKKYFIIIDTETTINDCVVDFGAVVCDKQGNVAASCGVLVSPYYEDKTNSPLFYNYDANSWTNKRSLDRRYKRYDTMLQEGSRMLASVGAINRWLQRAQSAYNPVMTAYNIAFDVDKMRNTGIDCDMFEQRFCLWHAAINKWGHTKAFRQFVLEQHEFNAPTKLKNMTFKTNAEVMARFVLGDASIPDEPHTALEDALDYELPILRALVKNTSPSKYMDPKPYNWKDFQVKNHYRA